MRLRGLIFPILIRHPNELEGGRGAGLHNLARFNWSAAEAYQDGRYDNVEIIDSTGHAYCVEKIFFMRPTLWRWFLDRLGHFLIFPPLYKWNIVRVDMALIKTRTLTFDQFKEEFRELILAHPAWWKRYRSREEIEGIFRAADSIASAINEIGFLAPSDFMVYKGRSTKIFDLRK